MANLDDLNAIAQEEFNQLKSKQGWSVEKIQALQRGRGIKVDKEKIENMIEAVETKRAIPIDVETVEPELALAITSPMNFIDALGLTPNIKIAIGFILASKDKSKLENLKQAILYLEQEILNG